MSGCSSLTKKEKGQAKYLNTVCQYLYSGANVRALRVWQVRNSEITPVYLIDDGSKLVSGKFFRIKNYEWDKYLYQLAEKYSIKFWGATTNSGAHWELYVTNYRGPFPIVKTRKLMEFTKNPEICGNRELKNCYEDWWRLLDYVLPWLAKQDFFYWLVEYTDSSLEIYEVAPLKELADNALAKLEERTDDVDIYRLELYPKWFESQKLWECDSAVYPLCCSGVLSIVHNIYGQVCKSSLERNIRSKYFTIIKVDDKAAVLNDSFEKVAELDAGIYLLVYKY